LPVKLHCEITKEFFEYFYSYITATRMGSIKITIDWYIMFRVD
jgi:hypothetical protein